MAAPRSPIQHGFSPLAAFALVCLGGALGFATAHTVSDLFGTGASQGPPLLAAASQEIIEPPPPEAAPPPVAEPEIPPSAPPPPAPAPGPAERAPGDEPESASTPLREDPPREQTPREPARTAAPVSAPEPPSTPEPEAAPEASQPTRPFRPRESRPPPPTRRIRRTDLPAGTAVARGALAAKLAAAPSDSTTASDLRFVLRLARSFVDSGTPEGRRSAVALTVRTNAWWFTRWPAPTRAVVVRDPDGRVYTYRAGRGFALNPVATTGRWQGINIEVPAPRLADALIEVAVHRRAGSRRFLALEYYDVPDQPGVIRPGTSGMAQGRLASLLAQAYRETGERRFAEASLGALAAFTVPVDRGGVVSRVADSDVAEPSPWYVERAYPGESAWKGAALNGFMVSLLNLRGTRRRLIEPPLAEGQSAPPRLPVAERAARLAGGLADAGADTLERYLPLHDSGEWSYYGLLTPGRPWRSYLADVNYHCYHVNLLNQLARIYPKRSFGETAAAWAGYADAIDATCERPPTSAERSAAPPAARAAFRAPTPRSARR